MTIIIDEKDFILMDAYHKMRLLLYYLYNQKLLNGIDFDWGLLVALHEHYFVSSIDKQ